MCAKIARGFSGHADGVLRGRDEVDGDPEAIERGEGAREETARPPHVEVLEGEPVRVRVKFSRVTKPCRTPTFTVVIFGQNLHVLGERFP